MDHTVPETVETFQANLKKFETYDYFTCFATLFGCAVIGLYKSFSSKKPKNVSTADEYLLGGRNMSVFPVAMSLTISFMSGIAFLSTPAEIYLYGTEYMFLILSIVASGFFSCFLFLPVFYKMRLTSNYEYLERRYDKNVRLFGSILFLIAQIVWLPVVIYVPALAFNYVSGVNIHLVTTCLCCICIFYTCVGGLKAVVWADLLQALIIIATVILVVAKGSFDVGGFGEVWKRNWEGDRIIIPSFDFDFTIRHSFWSIIFGISISYINDQVLSQNMAQKYLSLPTLKNAHRAFWIFILTLMLLYFLCCYSGLVLYATYMHCDPLTTGLTKEKDELLPLLAMKILGDYPGLSGLFVAGIFGASLSSLSTSLNSMSTVVLEDFVKPFRSSKLSERETNTIIRAVVLIFGILCVTLIFVVEKSDTVLQLSLILRTMVSGPQIGIFVCGLFLPWINERGALFGGILGLILNGILISGSQTAIASGELSFPTKPTSTENCNYYFDSKIISPKTQFVTEKSEIFTLFRLSYLWYCPIGAVATIIFALIISSFTGFSDLRTIDPLTISPLCKNYLRRTESQRLRYEEAKLINKLKTGQYAQVG